MSTSTVETTRPGSLAVLQQIRAFKAEARRRFPSLPDPALDTWPLREHDALAVYDFLDTLGRPAVAVDVGTFTGLSAFCLALHPGVTRVFTVDPNPLLHEEINQHVDIVGNDPVAVGDVRVLDVARDVLGAFPDAAGKIEIVEGVVGAAAGSAPRVDLHGLVGDDDVIALVDGLHTPEGVRSDLAAIFEAKPTAIAILDDCRHNWGPWVQAGIVDFLGERDGYRFTLLADVSPSFAQSDLGFVYPESSSDATNGAFERLQHLYSSFDPLAMVAREEELQQIVADTRASLAAANARADEWRRTVGLIEQSASWRLTKPLRLVKRALRRG